jgi:hypothetical protein
MKKKHQRKVVTTFTQEHIIRPQGAETPLRGVGKVRFSAT